MPFREIAGHRHLFALMTSAAVRGSLPPSLIFAGPEGVGKRRSAVALAQLLNCEAPVEVSYVEGEEPGRDACGVCSSCRRIGRGVHADILVIEPGDTGVIKVDQVREAIDRAAYRPFEGRRRVVIVDEADVVLVEAQNALLKTLEEPPPASTFVLVTSRPDVLLPTVRSRCQRLRFGRLTASEIAVVLIRDHEYSEADAYAAASASDGSVGLALEGGSDEYTEAREAAARLLEGAASSRDPRRLLEGAKVLTGGGGVDRDELGRRLRALSSLVRDLGALVSGADDGRLANSDLRPRLARLAASFDGERAVRAFAAIDRALSALERNASPKIVADWLAFQI
jgi:DNA polymerase-3 subunit delta'